MKYRRMPIEIESPEEMGYGNIDCNLTESSFADAKLGDLNLELRDLILCYGSHTGKKELREILAADSPTLRPEDVLITAGAATALFITSTSLLHAGDHVLVMRPNYATNIETPRALGANIEFLDANFETAFQIQAEDLRRKVRPETKLISLTFPHNPTGVVLSLKQLEEIIDFAESKKILLLFDETYREMSFHEPLPPAAGLSRNVISVSSLSKTYGLPGIRIGWLTCSDAALMETFLAAKEQILICNSVIDEEIAFRFLENKAARLTDIRAKIREHFGILKEWMNSESKLEWIEPAGGVVCFPRIRRDSGVDVERFYSILNNEYKTFVGPGHWFEMDRRHMRIGYGWPQTGELQRGLRNISLALQAAAK